jgi:CRP/FNR family cyclic AMP-dependent transcriptional regulator
VNSLGKLLFAGDRSEKIMCEIVTAHKIVQRRGWLSFTPRSFQRDLLDRCRLQRFKSGETIYHVGDPPGGMFGLVAGGLSVSIAPGEHGPYFAHFAQPGTWFGEAAAITGQPRRVGLSVTRDTVLLHLPLQEIHEIAGQNSEAWRLFALVTIGHLDSAIGASDDLMIRDHVKRCIAVLLRLGGCRRDSPSDSSSVEIDVSQEEIAVLSNIARTTASAILRKLEAQGCLEQSYRRIRILTPDALRAMLCDRQM